MKLSKPSFIVSLIGRPNVGKSSIFNRLMQKQHKVITYDQPGVTRDGHYGLMPNEVDLKKDIILVDTGGFYPEKVEEDDSFLPFMAEAAQIAIDESDLILLVMDIRDGLLSVDEKIVSIVRKSKKPFKILLNKCDTTKQELLIADFFALGISEEDLVMISAAHGRGVNGLKEDIIKFSELTQGQSEKSRYLSATPKGKLVGSLALIGAPNVGKSTLLNLFLGVERALVSPIAGTTVDPIEGHLPIHFTEEEKELLKLSEEDNEFCLKIVDTAGIRRKRAVTGFIESQSVYRSLRAITEADIVLYLIDAQTGITHQDRRLCDIVLEKGKSLVIGINKVDLIKETMQDNIAKREWMLDIEFDLPWARFCDIVPFSAKEKKGIKGIKQAIKETLFILNRKVETAEVNRCMTELVGRNPIMIKGSKSKKRDAPLKIKYSTIVKMNPPTFLLFANRSHNIPTSYRRYLQNGIREYFDFKNTPVHLVFRTGKEKEQGSTTN